MQLALAQATAALFQLYLRASGVDPADHESWKEQVRSRAAPGQQEAAWEMHAWQLLQATCQPPCCSSLRRCCLSLPPLPTACASGASPCCRPVQERLAQYGKKVRRAAAEKELRESRRSLEVGDTHLFFLQPVPRCRDPVLADLPFFQDLVPPGQGPGAT